MNLREQIEKEITEKVMTKLASEKVELGLIDDINKKLDKLNQERRTLQKQAQQIADKFNDIQPSYMKIFQEASKASDMAKELGINEAVKLFGARADEAKDYANVSGDVANRIKNAISKI